MNAHMKMADTLGVEPGFNLPDPSTLPSLKDKVSAEEWRLRCELAATYRLVAVSAQQYGLRRYSQFAMIVHDDVAYHDYEGIATDLDERARLVRDMGNHGFLILRNHGALTVGANCATAFLRMYFLEQACKAQILAQSDVKEPREEPPAMGAKVLQQGAPAFAAGMGQPRLAGIDAKAEARKSGWGRLGD